MPVTVDAGEPRVSRRLRSTVRPGFLEIQLSRQRAPICAGLNGDIAYPLDDAFGIPSCIVELYVRVLGDALACARLVTRTRRTSVRYAVLVSRARILV
jgi:hypothetical protein